MNPDYAFTGQIGVDGGNDGARMASLLIVVEIVND